MCGAAVSRGLDEERCVEVDSTRRDFLVRHTKKIKAAATQREIAIEDQSKISIDFQIISLN